jgi:hypothetical protein
VHQLVNKNFDNIKMHGTTVGGKKVLTVFEHTHEVSLLLDRLIWNIQCGKFWINHESQTFSKTRNLSVSYQITGFLRKCGRRYDFYIHGDKASYP